MIKFIATVWRKEDMTPEAFEHHWRINHAALVREHAASLGICRYVQSHRRPDEIIDAAVAGRGWLSPPDGLAEVCWTSLEAMQAAMATQEAQLANAALAEDEARFCSVTKMTAFLADEHVVFASEDAE